MGLSNSVGLELRAGEIEISDPDSLLKECVIFFTFPKSRSVNFPIAIGLAKSAPVYGEQPIEGRVLYWAGFRKAPSDLKAAAELMRLAGDWVGAIARIDGHAVKRPFNAYLTLSCYQEGLQCTNSAAHCHRVIDDPFHPNYDSYSKKVKRPISLLLDEGNSLETEEEIKEFVFPCKKMLEQSIAHPQFTFKRQHGVSAQEQIQAAAVEYGISICPLFEAESFREIGSHRIKVRMPLSRGLIHPEAPMVIERK